jgi:hypothetical protein
LKKGVARLEDIEPQDIDHILGYFIIRKYLMGSSFRNKVARATAAFFRHLSIVGRYDKDKASEVVRITSHYHKQYSRISKLESSLWDETEGEIDRLMKLPKKQQEAKLAKLRTDAKDNILEEVGYVSVERVEDGLIFGQVMGGEMAVGPVRVGQDSLKLVAVGDIVNMITLCKKPQDSIWEIAELGFVYPKPYFDHGSLDSESPELIN